MPCSLQRLEDRAQRAGFVRVVDKREKALPAVDRFQPARHGRGAQSRRGLLRRHPDGVEQRRGQQTVRDVVPARQRNPQPVMDACGVDREELLRAAIHGHDVLGPPVRICASHADGHRIVCERGHGAAGVVVDAHHRNVCVRRRLGVEQPRLGVEVVVHRRVEVQVVARQVGEAADREFHAVDPAESERVAGHLHHHGVDARLQHRRQQRLQLGRLGCGQRAWLIAPVDPHADRADQACHPPRGPQSCLDQIGRRGLTGGSGDPDDAQPLGRMAVDRGGQLAEHRPRIRVDQHRYVHAIVHQLGACSVGEHRDRAACHRVRCVTTAVRRRAGKGREQVAGARVLTTQRHTGDQDVLRRAWLREHRAHLLGQRPEGAADRVGGTQVHGVDTVPAARRAAVRLSRLAA